MSLKTDRRISSSRAKEHRGSSEGSGEEVWGLHVRKTLWLKCGEGPRWRGHVRRLLEARRAMAMGLARKKQLRALKKPREEKFQGGRTVNSVQWCREQMFIGCSDKSNLEWFTTRGRRVAREEWKGNAVIAVSELSPFLLVLVMISSSTSNLGERKRHLLGN